MAGTTCSIKVAFLLAAAFTNRFAAVRLLHEFGHPWPLPVVEVLIANSGPSVRPVEETTCRKFQPEFAAQPFSPVAAGGHATA